MRRHTVAHSFLILLDLSVAFGTISLPQLCRALPSATPTPPHAFPASSLHLPACIHCHCASPSASCLVGMSLFLEEILPTERFLSVS